MKKIDFDEQFAAYKSYMCDQIMAVAEYENFVDYCDKVPKTDMAASDFARYKAGWVMTETEFWNGLVSRDNVTKQMTKQALSGLN